MQLSNLSLVLRTRFHPQRSAEELTGGAASPDDIILSICMLYFAGKEICIMIMTLLEDSVLGSVPLCIDLSANYYLFCVSIF
jgi:hypothetical protein